jgi:hypothetical protein
VEEPVSMHESQALERLIDNVANGVFREVTVPAVEIGFLKDFGEIPTPPVLHQLVEVLLHKLNALLFDWPRMNYAPLYLEYEIEDVVLPDHLSKTDDIRVVQFF